MTTLRMISLAMLLCASLLAGRAGASVLYTIGGTVSGLTTTGLVIQNNNSDDLTIAANISTFTFSTALASGNPYAVTIKRQPSGQSCSVSNGNGTFASANVTNLAITCVSRPAQPTATVSYGIKQVILSWTATTGATYYKVSKAPRGLVYFRLANNLTATSYTDAVAVHLTDWINTRYKVSACNVAGCTDSAPIMAVSVPAIGYFKASNTDAGDFFGQSVALSADGNTLVVGALDEASSATGIGGNQSDDSAWDSGAVYVFTHNGSTWTQQAYLKASNSGENAGFGISVALSADGDTLAVGAPWESSNATGINGDQNNNGALGSGAVYVFHRAILVVARHVIAHWTQQAYVKASNTDASDNFGDSVALSADGSTLAVGAPYESSSATGIGGDQSDNSAPASGAVYIFTSIGTIWAQQAYLKASNTDMFDAFGYAVALSSDGNTLVAGAYGESSNTVGINGNQTDNSSARSGAAYVFTRTGGVWAQQAYVKASNTGADDLFGCSVALSADGNTLAVGAYREASSATGIGGNQSDNSAWDSGAVYVFTRIGSTWVQQAYVKASNTGVNDRFGYSVALSADGNTLAVGATGESSKARGIGGNQSDNTAIYSGAVYVFMHSGSEWAQRTYVKASNTDSGDLFGGAVSLSADGNTLAVGADDESSSATGVGGIQNSNAATDSGAVYMY